jgi:hypothetical protein
MQVSASSSAEVQIFPNGGARVVGSWGTPTWQLALPRLTATQSEVAVTSVAVRQKRGRQPRGGERVSVAAPDAQNAAKRAPRRRLPAVLFAGGGVFRGSRLWVAVKRVTQSEVAGITGVGDNILSAALGETFGRWYDEVRRPAPSATRSGDLRRAPSRPAPSAVQLCGERRPSSADHHSSTAPVLALVANAVYLAR